MPRTLSSYVLLLVALALSSCADESTSPGAPGPDRPAAAGKGLAVGRSSLDLIEKDYASGLLDRENANRYRQYAVSRPDRLPRKYHSAEVGKDATYSMVQMAKEWSRLSQATKEEILDIRRNGYGDLSDSVTTQHFTLHYTRQGNNAVPARDADGNGTPDFIDAAAESWEHVWDREVVQLGYPAPVGTPALRFHVYYRDFAYYGVTYADNVQTLATSPVPLGTASAYIEVENDFAGFPPNDEDVTGREEVRTGALKVTQAHEFMHACQFNINVYQSGWLFESHATWAEDAVYDQVNDWHWYIPFFFTTPDLPLFNRYVYGAAFFMNYLSETRGIDAPRQVWLAGKTKTTPAALRDAGFGGSWGPIGAFAPAEYLLGISDFTTDAPSQIPLPAVRLRATHTSYPVSVTVPASTNQDANRAPWGLGANFIVFEAGSSKGTLGVTFDGEDGAEWQALAVLTPARGGAPSVVALSLNSAKAGSASISGFGTRWSRVTLVPTIADNTGAEVPFSYGATLQ
jgi:Family of unknown function (DUF6055)